MRFITNTYFFALILVYPTDLSHEINLPVFIISPEENQFVLVGHTATRFIPSVLVQRISILLSRNKTIIWLSVYSACRFFVSPFCRSSFPVDSASPVNQNYSKISLITCSGHLLRIIAFFLFHPLPTKVEIAFEPVFFNLSNFLPLPHIHIQHYFIFPIFLRSRFATTFRDLGRVVARTCVACSISFYYSTLGLCNMVSRRTLLHEYQTVEMKVVVICHTDTCLFVWRATSHLISAHFPCGFLYIYIFIFIYLKHFFARSNITLVSLLTLFYRIYFLFLLEWKFEH